MPEGGLQPPLRRWPNSKWNRWPNSLWIRRPNSLWNARPNSNCNRRPIYVGIRTQRAGGAGVARVQGVLAALCTLTNGESESLRFAGANRF